MTTDRLIYMKPRQESTMTEPVVTPEPTAAVPEPVRHAAAVYGTVAAAVTTVLGVLVAVGALSTDQANSLGGVVDYVGVNFVPVASAIVGFATLISGVASSWVTAEVARRKVTPVAPAVVRTVRSDV